MAANVCRNFLFSKFCFDHFICVTPITSTVKVVDSVFSLNHIKISLKFFSLFGRQFYREKETE